MPFCPPPPPVPASLTRPGHRLGLVSHSLRGGGVPSSPPQRFNFCANPPPGCLHCAAPWGACWAPFCRHDGVELPYVCNACSVVRAARYHGPVQTW